LVFFRASPPKNITRRSLLVKAHEKIKAAFCPSETPKKPRQLQPYRQFWIKNQRRILVEHQNYPRQTSPSIKHVQRAVEQRHFAINAPNQNRVTTYVNPTLGYQVVAAQTA
jgi:hypothetical protein